MASCSVDKGYQVPFGGDVYLLVSYALHHRQAGLVSALLQGIPTKVLTLLLWLLSLLTNLTALLCTISSWFESVSCGVQTVEAYSRVGLTNVL